MLCLKKYKVAVKLTYPSSNTANYDLHYEQSTSIDDPYFSGTYLDCVNLIADLKVNNATGVNKANTYEATIIEV